MSARPDVGRTSPRRDRRAVVLPAPFGPRKPVTAPPGASKLRPSTAFTVPNRLLRAWNVMFVISTSSQAETGLARPGPVLPLYERVFMNVRSQYGLDEWGVKW